LLRARKPSTIITSSTDNKDELINSNRENRKHHLSIDTSPSQTGMSTGSPIHKKGTSDNIPPSSNSYNDSSKLSYCVATKEALKQNNSSTLPTNKDPDNFVSALTVL
jgi:hypothetical protein